MPFGFKQSDDPNYLEPIKEEPSIDDMFALAHAKARRLIEDTAIDDQERVDDVNQSVSETMKIIDQTLQERLIAF